MSPFRWEQPVSERPAVVVPMVARIAKARFANGRVLRIAVSFYWEAFAVLLPTNNRIERVGDTPENACES